MPLRLHVLIVDDDPEVRRAAARDLRNAGLAVTVVSNIAEARAQDGPFDCGVFDFGLPTAGGIELAREMLGRGTVRQAVFFSGQSDRGRKREALALGSFVDKRLGTPRMVEQVLDQVENRRAPSANRVFTLDLSGALLPLRPGRLVIGRRPSCDVVLPGNQISRKHAELRVTSTRLEIADLGSSNGVFVNGRPVKSATALRAGDTIRIGDHTMKVGEVADDATQSVSTEEKWTVAQRRHPNTGKHRPVSIQEAPPAREEMDSCPDATARHGFAALLDIVSTMLSVGHGDEALDLVKSRLTALLARARASRHVDPESAEPASLIAIKLAEATGDLGMTSYPIDLHAAGQLVMTGQVVDGLAELARKTPRYDRSGIGRYLKALDESGQSFSPTARDQLARIRRLV